jgi:hypothetical protein
MDLSSAEAVIRAQEKTIRTMRQIVSSIRTTQTQILRDLPEFESFQDRGGVTVDLSRYEPKLSEISAQLSELKARQSEIRAKFTADLDSLSRDLRAELAAVTAIVGSIPLEETPAPAPASATPADGLNFPYNPHTQLDGIIEGLTRQAGGNVGDKGVVDILCSECLDPNRFLAKYAADLKNDSVFVSGKDPNQWLAYDFKEKRVRITHYAIRSRFDGWVNSNNLKSWVIEVSEDGFDWTVVDQKKDNDELNGTNIIKVFGLESEAEGRLVRLRQTGPAHSGKYFIAISGFELYGSVLG